MPNNGIDPREIVVGMYVEMEHTDNRSIAKQIAMDHLRENPKYYSELVASGLVDEGEALQMYKSLFENNSRLRKLIREEIKRTLLKESTYHTKELDVAAKDNDWEYGLNIKFAGTKNQSKWININEHTFELIRKVLAVAG